MSLLITDALDRVTTYQYDNLGRKIEESLPDGDGNPATTPDRPQIKYQYNESGKGVRSVSK